ncbi:MAG: response regulator [Dehalococcoidia bacterium]|jgi:two-component system alkaline phosphatase synthesis response regulator PhoP|nr:response regulator [Dehalococcoidia bacterium]
MDKKPKILVIDDDVDLVVVMKGTLESKLFEVIVAYNGQEGLEKAKKEKPDLIILDIMMPVMDGFNFAEQFSKDPSLTSIPVLALTSFSESLGQPFPFQVSEYLTKPIKPKDLIAKVQSHLEKKNS